MKPWVLKAVTNPRRIALFVAAFLLGISLMAGSMNQLAAHAKGTPPTRQQIAQQILSSKAGKFLTSSARSALEMIARGDQSFSSNSQGVGLDLKKAKQARGGQVSSMKGAFTNVRVNNPNEDNTFVDQTTQSETTIAVAGKHVAVGFNDSQTTGLFLTAGSDLTGYAYSDDGGKTFVDGGQLPNAPADINFGDPWLASDSAGNMYFSNLVEDPNQGALFVGVARSTNGGKTWSVPVIIPPPAGVAALFYSADKDAMTAGPGVGNLYVSWDDITFDNNTGDLLSGLAIAHSTDGGQTWTTVYADQVPIFDSDQTCSFAQYIGAQPIVGPDGTVFDAALKLSIDDPNCSGAPQTESEWIFGSHDGGATFTQKVKIADVTASVGGAGAFQLGPGQFMRVLEFPTLAFFGGNLYATWMDGGDGSGHTHIRLASSSDGGQTWNTSFVTSGLDDEAQPSISSDSSGLHILYYQISPVFGGNTSVLDVFVANSTNGSTFTDKRVTTQSFPGVFTSPQFDPIIASTYMGDYISNVSDGSHQYFAWGDNRDIVKNILWPNGRHDPDVFFARQ